MEKLAFLLCLGFPLFVSAQIDTAAVEREVDSLIQLAQKQTQLNAFDQALEINAVAESLALEKLGEQSAAYANACSNHGVTLRQKGDLPGAEKWHLKTLSIREKTVGVEHPDYAKSMNNLANVYNSLNDFVKAEAFYLQTLHIR